jgi:hypothetical protein
MKENLIWIIEVVDESGSMGDIKSDTIGAYNLFINEQKKVEGEALISLIKFNTKIEKVYENMDIKEVPILNENTYTPRTYTRLYDAIGYTIKDVKNKIKTIPEEERPEKVLFVILTDGKENSSTEYSKEKVFKKIKKYEAKNWEFIYLGANQDAMEEGGKIGIKMSNAATWSADSKGVNVAFMSASNYTTKFRKSKSKADYLDVDLTEIYKDEEKKS